MKKLGFWRSEAFGSAGGSCPGDTTILPVSRVEKPKLGRYQLEAELGKGATGTVYLARDRQTDRAVAIKVITALAQEIDPEDFAEIKGRFLLEADIARRLTHPNIVTIYDAGEEHDLAYVAMEFIKGRDLASYVKPDSLLPLPKVLSIVARVAEALAYAHKNSIVHRDIKPANIMYDPETDTVKVTDFGIARITDSSSTGMVLGTPSYMSPEQLAGGKVEGRSDLFSLGTALYQMACGRLPFEGDSMALLMFKIANEVHGDIRAHDNRLPACVAAVVDKALAKNPGQRYQDGALMARALKLCVQNLTTGAARAVMPAPASAAPAVSS